MGERDRQQLLTRNASKPGLDHYTTNHQPFLLPQLDQARILWPSFRSVTSDYSTSQTLPKDRICFILFLNTHENVAMKFFTTKIPLNQALLVPVVIFFRG